MPASACCASISLSRFLPAAMRHIPHTISQDHAQTNSTVIPHSCVRIEFINHCLRRQPGMSYLGGRLLRVSITFYCSIEFAQVGHCSRAENVQISPLLLKHPCVTFIPVLPSEHHKCFPGPLFAKASTHSIKPQSLSTISKLYYRDIRPIVKAMICQFRVFVQSRYTC